MEDTSWYNQDPLGIKTLNEAGRFLKLNMHCGHDLFSMDEAEELFPYTLML